MAGSLSYNLSHREILEIKIIDTRSEKVRRPIQICQFVCKIKFHELDSEPTHTCDSRNVRKDYTITCTTYITFQSNPPSVQFTLCIATSGAYVGPKGSVNCCLLGHSFIDA